MGIKQRNFRLDDEAVEKFAQICDELGVTQAQGFAHIVQVAELEQAKGLLTSRETEIEDFQSKVKGLISAYLYSLELNENAEIRVRESFEAALLSKDTIISDYQKELEELQEQLRNHEDRLSLQQDLENEILQVKDKLFRQQEKYALDFAEKNRLNELLSDKVKGLELALQDYESLQQNFEKVFSQNNELKSTIMEQEFSHKDTVGSLQQEIKDIKKESALISERITLDLERKHSEALRELEQNHNNLMMDIMTKLQDMQEEKAKLSIELAKAETAAGSGKENKRFGR